MLCKVKPTAYLREGFVLASIQRFHGRVDVLVSRAANAIAKFSQYHQSREEKK